MLCYLDGRIRFVLAEVSGSERCPFLNVRLEDAEEVLVHLVLHPDEAAELGRDARAWLERHWADHVLAREYAEIYEQLLENPERVRRQPDLGIDASARVTAIVLPDLIWASRRRAALASRPLRTKALEAARRAYRRLPLPLRLAARRLLGRPR